MNKLYDILPDLLALKAIPKLHRYVGMEVTVLDTDGYGTKKKYTLVGGTADSNWQEGNIGGALPVASPTVLGGIKIGTGLSIDEYGMVSAEPAPDDGGILSIVPGANVTVDNTDPANPIVSVTGGDWIGEAPIDSQQYARKDGDWELIDVNGLPARVAFVDTAPAVANSVVGTNNFVLGSGITLPALADGVTVLGSDTVTVTTGVGVGPRDVAVLASDKVTLGKVYGGLVAAAGNGVGANVWLGDKSATPTESATVKWSAIIGAESDARIDNSYDSNYACNHNLLLGGKGHIAGGTHGVILASPSVGTKINNGQGNVLIGCNGTIITSFSGHNFVAAASTGGGNITGGANALFAPSSAVSGSGNLAYAGSAYISGSGNLFHSGGGGGTLSGNYCAVVGNNCQVFANYNAVFGYQPYVTGSHNIVMTNGGDDGKESFAIVQAANHIRPDSTIAGVKSSRRLAAGGTSDATATSMKVPGTATPFIIERYQGVMAQHHMIVVEATVIGTIKGTAPADFYMRKFRQVFNGQASGVAVPLGAVTEVEKKTAGTASGWDADFVTSVGLASAGVGINVTGEADKQISWAATVEITHLRGA